MRKNNFTGYISGFWLILLTMASCQKNEYQSLNSSYYFDLDSLVSEQIIALTRVKAELNKEAQLGDDSESISLHPDSLAWESELKIFRESNINKYAYSGLYLVQKKKPDDFSNLFFDEYSAESPDKLPVDKLKVYYLESPEFLKKIVVELSAKNELFESAQKLLMTFEDVEGKPLLMTYEVEGSQKLKLNNPVKYQVKAKIIL